MMLHGIEVPVQVKHGNTLSKPLSSWDQEFDVIVTNPPFGGTEEDGIEKNFPSELQTRETADLFLQFIIEVQASPKNGQEGGRAPVVLPNGTLFGEEVKTKIKKRSRKTVICILLSVYAMGYLILIPVLKPIFCFLPKAHPLKISGSMSTLIHKG
jgi:type I restriction-modification system DNA methylase subunit